MILPRENLVRASSNDGAVSLSSPEKGGTPNDGRLGTLNGHFAVFDVWTEIHSAYEGNFLERFAPTAMQKTISEGRSRMRALFQHGQDSVIGSKPLGPIEELRSEDAGAYYEVSLLDTSYNRDLLPGLKAGLYGASFRFQVVREDVVQKPKISDYNPAGLPERTVLEARVIEFGPVTFGQYPEATAGVRSMTDEFMMGRLLAEPDRLREVVEAAKASRARVAPKSEPKYSWQRFSSPAALRDDLSLEEELEERKRFLLDSELAERKRVINGFDRSAPRAATTLWTPPVGATRTAPRTDEIPELRASAPPSPRKFWISSLGLDALRQELLEHRNLLEDGFETGGWLFAIRHAFNDWQLLPTGLGIDGERRHHAVLLGLESRNTQERNSEGNDRQHYVGRWHVHPYAKGARSGVDDTQPSPQDLRNTLRAFDRRHREHVRAAEFALDLIITPDRDRSYSKPHFSLWCTDRGGVTDSAFTIPANLATAQW